jgi:hypothetical protein
MTAYVLDPAVTLYDASGSLQGVQGNPLWVNAQGVQQTGSLTSALPVVVGGTDVSGTVSVPLVDRTGVQYVTLTSPAGANSTTGRHVASVLPRGNLNVTLPGTTLFVDKFDAERIETDNWNVRIMNGGSIDIITGALTLQTVTSSYSRSMVNSKFSPTSMANAALHFSAMVKVTKFVSGVHYFWGFGCECDNLSNYMLDGIGFECDASGSYNAVIYIDSNVIYRCPMNSSIASDSYNIYRMFVYNNEVYYYGDSLEAPIAIARISDWSHNKLPVMLHVFNDGVTTSDWSQMIVTSVAVADLGRNNTTISDPDKPWQRASVDEYGSQRSIPMDAHGATLTCVDGEHFMNVHDEDLLQTMQAVLRELKKLNLHMSMLTNVQIRNSDLID